MVLLCSRHGIETFHCYMLPAALAEEKCSSGLSEHTAKTRHNVEVEVMAKEQGQTNTGQALPEVV